MKAAGKWAARQSWRGTAGYERIERDAVGEWPEIYEDAKGDKIVTGLYFAPNAGMWIRLARLAMTAVPLAVEVALMPSYWDAYWYCGVIVVTVVVAWQITRIPAYRLMAKRLKIMFSKDGAVKTDAWTIPAGISRSFEKGDHPEGIREQLRESEYFRQKGAAANAQPRYYRDSCRVSVRYGGGNMHRGIVADIGYDPHQAGGEKLRGVLEYTNEIAGKPLSTRAKPVKVGTFD